MSPTKARGIEQPLSTRTVVAARASTGYGLRDRCGSHGAGVHTPLFRFPARDPVAKRLAEDRVIGASEAGRGRSSHSAGEDAGGRAGQAGRGDVHAAKATIFGAASSGFGESAVRGRAARN